MSNTEVRSRWGRPRMGGTTAALVIMSLLLGAAISAILGGLFAWSNGGPTPLLSFLVVAIAPLPISVMLAWAILVDRTTLTGALDKPEESIESAWYEKAASGAFGDILIVSGLGATGFSLARLDVPASLLLIAVTAFAMLDFGARYLWLKKAAT